MKRTNSSRRRFIKKTAAAAVGFSLPTIIPSTAFGSNDKVTLAVLGLNGRGKDHIKGFQKLSNVEIVSLCDPDEVVLKARGAEFKKEYGKNVKLVIDLREVLEAPDVDAVSIATPNHWHTLAAIWACKAGKDVYVEKPCSQTFEEGRQLVMAAKKFNRIVQHGVQLRSSEAIQEAIRQINDGLLGEVYMSRGICHKLRPDIGDKGTEQAPATLNYDLWTGPAELLPFSKNYVHYNWHWNWNFGNGDIGNQGIHQTDVCLWSLGLQEFPEQISALGGQLLFSDCKQTPELLNATFLYPKRKKMIEFEVRPWMTNLEDAVEIGNFIYGSEGYMVITQNDTYQTFLGKDRKPGPKKTAGGDHFKNFIDAVVASDPKLLNASIESGHLASGLAHLANISYRTGRTLIFDNSSEKFISDDEANALLTRQHRAPFTM